MSGQKRNRGRNIAPLVKQEIIQTFLSGKSNSYDLSIKYGIDQMTVYSIIRRYKQKNTLIFEDQINIPVMGLKKKTSAEDLNPQLEHEELKRQLSHARLQLEGYRIMGEILEEEYGIDLLKKVEAGQCHVSKKDTQKSACKPSANCSAIPGKPITKA